MTTKKNYKQIVIAEVQSNTSIFHLSESKYKNEDLYILGLAQFAEYVEYAKPLNIIIDKSNTHDSMHSALYEHFQKFGLDSFYKSGVRKIYYINAPELMINCRTNNKFIEIKNFPDIETCLNHITSEEENKKEPKMAHANT
ncbi:MAG: hypothetical protein AB7S48_03040 [Bacteroidales bacterium]